MFEELVIALIVAQLGATGGIYWRLFRTALLIERRLGAIEAHIGCKIDALEPSPPLMFHKRRRD